MNVLSLFDGISAGQVALERANIKVDNYYASEIDKYAIKVTMHNYPNTIQLGSVVDIHTEMIPHKIDLLIGGSPCQGFSFAGKQLNFNDPRSALFFEYVRILKELKAINPNVKFLLENVRMKKEYQDVITAILGVEPILINSAILSAQNRKRLYWTNIKDIIPPENKNIMLRDILETDVEERYFMNQTQIDAIHQSNYQERKPHSIDGKMATLKVGGDVKRIYLSDKALDKLERHNNKVVETKEIPNKSATIHAGYAKMGGRDQQYVIEPSTLNVPEATRIGSVDINPNEGVDLTFPNSTTCRGRRMEDKSNCLTATKTELCWWDGYRVRKLTPVECERLQTFPDGYTSVISNSQRYKSLGNSWTVDIVAHIFKHLNNV